MKKKSIMILLTIGIFSFYNSCKKEDLVLVNNIALKTAPQKLIYIEGNYLEISDIVIYIEMSNGEKEEIAYPDFSANNIICNPSNGKELLHTDSVVTITHSESRKSISFRITVVEKEITDYDGNTYKTITIGTQAWLAENLETTSYNDGIAIPNIINNSDWIDLKTPAYCWYNNDQINSKKNNYGALYNWYTVEASKLCPLGWHVPSDDDWKELEVFLGMSDADLNINTGPINSPDRGTNEGTQLKATFGWSDGLNGENGNGTDNYGFSAFPSGERDGWWDGKFTDLFLGSYTQYWTSTESPGDYAYNRSLVSGVGGIKRTNEEKQYGYSIRCIKDK